MFTYGLFTYVWTVLMYVFYVWTTLCMDYFIMYTLCKHMDYLLMCDLC